jgi:hypothetical protein
MGRYFPAVAAAMVVFLLLSTASQGGRRGIFRFATSPRICTRWIPLNLVSGGTICRIDLFDDILVSSKDEMSALLTEIP